MEENYARGDESLYKNKTYDPMELLRESKSFEEKMGQVKEQWKEISQVQSSHNGERFQTEIKY